ncbi:hypothetical protein K1719_036631 [Acacia pycnantha]|nr:hypothetical protein K1719_036631 [Acacia pycnantha]
MPGRVNPMRLVVYRPTWLKIRCKENASNIVLISRVAAKDLIALASPQNKESVQFSQPLLKSSLPPRFSALSSPPRVCHSSCSASPSIFTSSVVLLIR